MQQYNEIWGGCFHKMNKEAVVLDIVLTFR